MKNSTYTAIKAEKAKKMDQLIKDCRMFFAFSDQQFEDSKTELAPGEKYVSVGVGAYLPKSCLQTFIDGSAKIETEAKAEIKNSKQQEAEILYELRNHECFYTGDITDALYVLDYTKAEVIAVFNKFRVTEDADW